MLKMATSATSNKELDRFWGQPHTENETFSYREFEPYFMELYMSEPFLSFVGMATRKVIDPTCDTAYIAIEPDSLELVFGFNPYFFRHLKSEKTQGVIMHEILHVVLMHITERYVNDNREARIWNVATDLAVNSLIPANKLPSIGLIPGKKPAKSKPGPLTDYITNAKPMLSAELYFEDIKKILRDNPNLELPSAMDDHEFWRNIPEGMKDMVLDKLRNHIKDAIDRADQNNAWGSVPKNIQKELRDSMRGEIAWSEIMKMFFGRTRILTRISTIKKISKKLPGIMPGVKRGSIARFAFFIDQSGSMSNKDVSAAFAEVELASKESEIDVYNFDTNIDLDSHKVWRKGQKFPWKRTRSGGTNFNAVADFVNSPANRGKWAGIVILTDGYADPMKPVVGCKVLWVLTGNGVHKIGRPEDLIFRMSKNSKE